MCNYCGVLGYLENNIMNKLTHEQADAMLAEMMGDELTQFGASCSIDLESGEMEYKPAYFDKDDKLFIPTTNPAHALQALGVWDSKNGNYYRIVTWPNRRVELIHGSCIVAVARFYKTTLHVAITTALCSAISNEPVTIEEGE